MRALCALEPLRLLQLLLLLSGGLRASAKRLLAFGDSITDNGNGTNRVVQAFYTNLLGQPVTAYYPPGPFFDHGRWSNGPTWAEYLSDMVGYELVDNAVGSSMTNKTMSYHGVGDFYPSNLLSNKRGALNVTLPTFSETLDAYLAKNTVEPDDVVVVEIGVNDLLGFFESNILTTLEYVEEASAENATYPMYIIQGVADTIMEGLEALHTAGGRKFLVWHVVAGDVVPLITVLNNLVNEVNAALTEVNKALGHRLGNLNTRPDALRTYTKTFVDLANAAIGNVTAAFAAAHPDSAVALFPLAEVQRGFVEDYDSLGFVNAVNNCYSDLTFTQYATGNLYSLADPTFTFDAAKTTLQLSPLLVTKLNKLGADLYGVNGQANVPSSTADFLARLRDILSSYLDDSNTLGHLTGAILTSLPLGKGGFSPYSVVPTCLFQAGDHLFHDEVHPTTRQHQLIAQKVQDQAGSLFT